jgi:hypothetical protein
MNKRFPFVTNRVSELHGYSICDRRSGKGWENPTRIFFIYISLDPSFQLSVKQFYRDFNAGSDIDKLEDEIFSEAKSPGNYKVPKGYKPKKGEFPAVFRTGFESVDFGWKPCYVTMVIDIKGWKFSPWDKGKIKNEYEETIIFRYNKFVMEEETKDELQSKYPQLKRYMANGSFFNFERREIKGCDAVRFMNFMKKDLFGANLPTKDINQIWNYCMDVYIKIPYDPKSIFNTIKSFSSNDKIVKDWEKSYFDQNIVSIEGWLPVVFDPPQTNGGGSGPPN